MLKGITEIISIAGVIAYLLISFLTGAWHITWIIFIAIGLVNAIVKLIFGLKDDTKEEVKGEEDNE